MKPKWQRARLISPGSATVLVNPGLVGRLVWVKAERPTVRDAWAPDWPNRPMVPAARYETNIIVDGAPMVMDADCAELLSEFAHDVPLVSFDQWLAER